MSRLPVCTRPPVGFVSVTRTRWRELCTAIGVDELDREIRRDGALIGWRRSRCWFVDPVAYRHAIGAFPDGYWPL